MYVAKRAIYANAQNERGELLEAKAS
jgi:hypothetical protein